MRPIFKMSMFLFLGGFLFITGCKPDKTVEATSTLTLHLHTNFGDEVEDGVYYNDPYHTNPNHSIQVTRAQYYLSNFKLIKTDNTSVSVDSTVLIYMGQEEYSIGKIPVGTYKSITFDVGLQPTLNHSEPSTHTGSTDPLNSSNNMHLATNTDGYVFLAFEGLDSVTGGTTVPFSIHLGTDAQLKTVAMGDHTVSPLSGAFNATATSGIIVHLVGDYSALVSGFNPANTPSIDPINNNAISTSIANKVPQMFSYEE